MRIKPKELAIIKKRRTLWAIFGWAWAYKRENKSRYSTEYTDNPEDGKGIGFFRNNHSSCATWRVRRFEKRQRNKVARKRSKEEINQEMKRL